MNNFLTYYTDINFYIIKTKYINYKKINKYNIKLIKNKCHKKQVKIYKFIKRI